MPGKLALSRRLQWTAIVLAVSCVILSCQLVNSPEQTSVVAATPTAALVATTPSPLAPTQALPQPTQTPVPIQPTGQVEVLEYLYSQDFSTVPPEWLLTPYDSDAVSVSYQLRDGVYAWEVTARQGSALWNLPDPAIALPTGDFLFTATIHFTTPGSPAAAGLMFRVLDDDNFYFAKLSPAGEVSVYALQGDQWIKLVEPVQSDHFNAGQPNRLIVTQTGGVYEVQVNDYAVLSFRDNRFQGGNFGIITDLEAESKAVITFDDVRVMQPTSSGAAINDATGRPTLMPLGASYQTFTSSYNDVPYSIDHPFVFVQHPSEVGEQLCLDAPEILCVTIQPQTTQWTSAEAMADAVISSFRGSVKDYQELHRQSTVTMEDIPAYWVGYTYTSEGKALQGSRLFVVTQQASFDIKAEGEPVMMELYQTVIKIMLESFRLKEY